MFGRKKNNNYAACTFMFLAGTIAGAAIALLYAPMKGRKMQQKVANVTEKVIGAVGEQVETMQGAMRKLARV